MNYVDFRYVLRKPKYFESDMTNKGGKWVETLETRETCYSLYRFMDSCLPLLSLLYNNR